MTEPIPVNLPPIPPLAVRAAQEPILQFFEYEHLPPRLGKISEMFFQLAQDIVSRCPRNPERTVALRKLLEAKDAAVRSVIYTEAPLQQGRFPP